MPRGTAKAVLYKCVLLAVTAIAAVACAPKRPYTAPQVEPAAMLHADAALTVQQPLDTRWWGQFEDPVLDGLITHALDANRDVQSAFARVEQARAFFDDARLDRFPEVPVSASYDRRDQAIPGFTEGRRGVSTYRLGFDASLTPVFPS